MTTLVCDICQFPLLCPEDSALGPLVMEAHRRAEHPDVLPWACETCFYIPPGVKAVRCTDIHDGICCPMYLRSPAWLSP